MCWNLAKAHSLYKIIKQNFKNNTLINFQKILQTRLGLKVRNHQSQIQGSTRSDNEDAPSKHQSDDSFGSEQCNEDRMNPAVRTSTVEYL